MKKTYLIDLDGTMYRGTEIIEGAKEFIDYLISQDHPFCDAYEATKCGAYEKYGVYRN